MVSCHPNSNPLWFQTILNTFANFSCKTFLRLQAARKSPNYPTQLGNANNLTIRQVTDIYEAYYWREVMLAAAYLEIEVPAHLRDRWDERLNLSADDLDQIVTKILAVYRAGAAKILAR